MRKFREQVDQPFAETIGQIRQAGVRLKRQNGDGCHRRSGWFSRNTPNELRTIANRRGLDGEELVRTSRLTARVDNNAIADGFQIYLHSFVLTSTGEWAVVQQGMNESNGLARRYHWHSAAVRDFIEEPHSGIVGEHQGDIMNLVDRQAKPAQSALDPVGIPMHQQQLPFFIYQEQLPRRG